MSEDNQRRLAAIVSVDVVGYSRLMGLDEDGTLATLRRHRAELIDPMIAKHSGRIVKTMGDGLLLEFPSVVNAVKCVVEIQQGMAERNEDIDENRRIIFRVGVNLGDIIIDGEDILGDGVNITARLQEIAAPGEIAISHRVYEEVRTRLDSTFRDAGEQTLKNIAVPVKVWRWVPQIPQRFSDIVASTSKALPLPDKPSIAVLPFDNMSGDSEQEFFADGIAEDVITALSRFHSLFVIARNSSFSYKGTSPDIRAVASELGVRYVVEGSVRKAGNRVRITAQLIEAGNGNHIWADRFDGNLDDVFDLQDQITEQIVVTIEPEIGARERERARRKPPESLDAWELVQRGLSHFYRFNQTDNNKATLLFKEAIALDPEFAVAHAYLADALRPQRTTLDSTVETAKAVASARKAAEKAVSINPNEPVARFALGRLRIYAGEVEMGIGEMQTAIEINRNFARGHYGLGWAHYYGGGQAKQALAHFDAALRLSPRDPWRFMTLMLKGTSLRQLGQHDEAVENCRQSCQFPDCGFLPHVNLGAALAEAGQESEARVVIEKTIRLQPGLSIGFLRDRFTNMHKVSLTSLLDSIRKAGVPE